LLESLRWQGRLVSAAFANLWHKRTPAFLIDDIDNIFKIGSEIYDGIYILCRW
jgi:hypothetical protein